jgi:hypothetical protein
MYRFVDLILIAEGNVKLDFKVYCAKIWTRNDLITGSGEQALRLTFLEILDISWPAEQLSVSQDALCSTQLAR